MPQSVSTNRTLVYVKLFCLTGMNIFMIMIMYLFAEPPPFPSSFSLSGVRRWLPRCATGRSQYQAGVCRRIGIEWLVHSGVQQRFSRYRINRVWKGTHEGFECKLDRWWRSCPVELSKGVWSRGRSVLTLQHASGNGAANIRYAWCMQCHHRFYTYIMLRMYTAKLLSLVVGGVSEICMRIHDIWVTSANIRYAWMHWHCILYLFCYVHCVHIHMHG
jgi:hypothetical protein